MLRARLLRSEEDLKKGNVRFEVNTWRVLLAVTFGTFYGEKIFWIVNPIFKSHGNHQLGKVKVHTKKFAPNCSNNAQKHNYQSLS